MASIGHVAVGLALSRTAPPAWKTRFVLAALALAPDADVAAFAFHIPYAATFGHRGATHSFVFAAVLAAAVTPFAKRLQLSYFKTFVVAFAALASHGILDAMTTGGLGPALLWPFSNDRLFLGWRPIPVAPIGVRVLHLSGLKLMLNEALLFLPFWLIAFFPRRK